MLPLVSSSQEAYVEMIPFERLNFDESEVHLPTNPTTYGLGNNKEIQSIRKALLKIKFVLALLMLTSIGLLFALVFVCVKDGSRERQLNEEITYLKSLLNQKL